MCSDKVFLQGMKFLKCTYLSSQIDYTNKDIMTAWRMHFESLDDKSFLSMVKEYCLKNQYPPRSPFELKQILIDRKVQRASGMMDRIGLWLNENDGWYSKKVQETIAPNILRVFGRAAYETWHAVGNEILMAFPSRAEIQKIWNEEYPKHREAILEDIDTREDDYDLIGFRNGTERESSAKEKGYKCVTGRKSLTR